MSTVAIKCPNCGATVTTMIEENQYQCKYCDNIFNYVDPNVTKISRDAVGQQMMYNCSICGRAMQSRFGDKCMKCKKNGFCHNCIFELDNVFQCKTCIAADSRNCPICGKPISGFCVSCMESSRSGKIDKSQVSRTCADHLAENSFHYITQFNYEKKPGGYDVESYYYCKTCGGGGTVCFSCVIIKKKIRGNKYICKSCGNKLELRVPRTERDNKV